MIGASLRVVASFTLGLLGLYGIFVWSTGETGVVEVEASQVAVVADYLSGETRVLSEPGYCFYLPWLQEVFLLDKRPTELRMLGEEHTGADRAPRLTVRASDGSNFWFDTVLVEYQIRPEAADTALSDSGARKASHCGWVRHFARSVLRDQFGRFTAQEAANATLTAESREAARGLLNERLLAHGLEITQISAPEAKFDRDYEKTINDRKVAEGEVSRLEAELEQLDQLRAQRLAKLEKEIEIERKSLEGNLASQLIQARQKEVKTRAGADEYASIRRAKGEAKRESLVQKSEALLASLGQEVTALERRLELLASLEEDGRVAVREALVKKLSGVRFELIPYDYVASKTGGKPAAGSGGQGGKQ